MPRAAPYAHEYLDCPGYKGPYVAGNNGGKGCTAIETAGRETIIFKLNRAGPDLRGHREHEDLVAGPEGQGHQDRSTTTTRSPPARTRSSPTPARSNWCWSATTSGTRRRDPLRTALPDKFIFKFGDDEATVDQRLFADGAADKSSVSFAGVQPENIAKTNQANVKDRVIESTDICRRYIAFNQQKPLLKNQKMREALYYGLDRTSYRDGRGGERLAAVVDSIIPQDLDGYKAEETFKAPPEGDPVKAKQLLTEAGYKGEKLVLANLRRGSGRQGRRGRAGVLEGGRRSTSTSRRSRVTTTTRPSRKTRRRPT